jgi:hypothetical protein
MALQHLPRPWLLAALADMPMTMLAQEDAEESDATRKEQVLPRPEARRRRLGARQPADQWSDPWYGEDCWQGVEQWRDLEVERAN